MQNKYKKQDNHKVDKWGNIIPKSKPIDKKESNKNSYDENTLNNPFKEFFKGFKFEDVKYKK